jgi:type II secretory pathway component GspD/PulD (secretin)
MTKIYTLVVCVLLLSLSFACSPTKSNPAATAQSPMEASKKALDNNVRWDVIEQSGPNPIVPKMGSTTTIATTRPTEESTSNYQIVDMDPKVRIIWRLKHFGGSTVASSRDAATSRRTVALKSADLTPIVTSVQQLLGTTGTVLPLPNENTLLVTCDKKQQKSVVDLLTQLDISQPQVEIAVKIFEVSSDFDFQTGSNLIANRTGVGNQQSAISTFGSQRALNSSVTGQPYQGSVVSLMKTFDKAGVSIDASFQILADTGLIKVVSEPRMTVALGQTGYMLAGQELPIQSVNMSANVLQTSTQYKPVGVQLYITPQSLGDGNVKLHTISVVSSISGFSPLPTLRNNQESFLMNPIIDSREAETSVTIKNGDTLVISGLRMMQTVAREEKIPGLGDLPVLGWMFKNHRSQQKLTDLYFFVTPLVSQNT